jgi:type II secretory pathway component PulF
MAFLQKSNKTEQDSTVLHTIKTGEFDVKSSVLNEIQDAYMDQGSKPNLQDIKNINQLNRKKRGSSNITKAKRTFLDTLALLISSGMGINTSLRTLHKNIQDKALKKTLYSMLVSVENGNSLSQAMSEHNFLPKFLISLIKIGEESGNLADKIRRTVISVDKDRRRKGQLRSALFYPLFVMSFVIVLGVLTATFILPRIGQVFSNMNVKLPLLTKILIQIGNFMGTYWYIVIPSILGTLTLTIMVLFVLPATRKSGQWLLFHLPVFKDLIQMSEVSRFSYNLSMLLNSGIPITKALFSLSEIHDYYMYKEYTKLMAADIQDGKSFHNTFGVNQKKTNTLFPFAAQEIITAGEESGKLPEVLEQLGERYEEEADQIAKNIAVLLEPALLIIVWLGVVFLAVAILLPIYSLVGNFQT